MVLDGLKDKAAKAFKSLRSLKAPRDVDTRTDASRQDVIRVQVVSSGYDKADPFDFVPNLILYDKNNIDSKDHRIAVSKHDPLAKFAVYGIADAALDQYPDFINKEGEPIDSMNELVLPRLQELKVLEKLKYACYGERIHGWSLLVLLEGVSELGDEDAEYMDFLEGLKTPSEGEPDRIEAFHGEADVQVDEYDNHPDRLGKPKMWKITIKIPEGKGTKLDREYYVHHTRTIVINPRPVDRSHVGLSALAPAWDGLVLLRNIQYAMAFYDIKFGGGFFYIGPKEGQAPLGDTDKTKIEEIMKNVSTRQGVFSPVPIEFRREGGQGAVSYENHIDAILDAVIAPGLQIPKDILKGVSAGTVTGSEVNLRELYTTINAVQKSYEKILTLLIKRLFPKRDFGEFYYDWPLEFTLDEKERVEVDKVKSETLATATAWKTINEIREDEGLDPIDGGNVVLSLQQQQFKFTTEPAEPTTRKEEVIQEAAGRYNRDFKNFTQLSDYMRNTVGGVLKSCQELGVSSKTWYQWRDEENGTKS